MKTFKGLEITPEVAVELEKVVRLEHENQDLIRKLIVLIRENMGQKRDNTCLRAVIKRQAARIEGFKKICGRLHWKACVIALLICSPAAAETFTRYGDQTVRSDGVTFQTHGDTTTGSDGSEYTRIGGTTYSSSGKSYKTNDDAIYKSGADYDTPKVIRRYGSVTEVEE